MTIKGNFIKKHEVWMKLRGAFESARNLILIADYGMGKTTYVHEMEAPDGPLWREVSQRNSTQPLTIAGVRETIPYGMIKNLLVRMGVNQNVITNFQLIFHQVGFSVGWRKRLDDLYAILERQLENYYRKQTASTSRPDQQTPIVILADDIHLMALTCPDSLEILRVTLNRLESERQPYSLIGTGPPNTIEILRKSNPEFLHSVSETVSIPKYTYDEILQAYNPYLISKGDTANHVQLMKICQECDFNIGNVGKALEIIFQSNKISPEAIGEAILEVRRILPRVGGVLAPSDYTEQGLISCHCQLAVFRTLFDRLEGRNTPTEGELLLWLRRLVPYAPANDDVSIMQNGPDVFKTLVSELALSWTIDIFRSTNPSLTHETIEKSIKEGKSVIAWTEPEAYLKSPVLIRTKPRKHDNSPHATLIWSIEGEQYLIYDPQYTRILQHCRSDEFDKVITALYMVRRVS